MPQLFSNQASDGDSATFKHVGEGRALNIYVAGSLGGGTVQVQAQTPDKSAWVDVSGGELAAPGLHLLKAAPFVGRLRLSGASGANVSAWVETADNATFNRVFYDA